jgi:hypothetical protein
MHARGCQGRHSEALLRKTPVYLTPMPGFRLLERAYKKPRRSGVLGDSVKNAAAEFLEARFALA